MIFHSTAAISNTFYCIAVLNTPYCFVHSQHAISPHSCCSAIRSAESARKTVWACCSCSCIERWSSTSCPRQRDSSLPYKSPLQNNSSISELLKPSAARSDFKVMLDSKVMGEGDCSGVICGCCGSTSKFSFLWPPTLSKLTRELMYSVVSSRRYAHVRYGCWITRN